MRSPPTRAIATAPIATPRIAELERRLTVAA